jgi:hypothetical protein
VKVDELVAAAPSDLLEERLRSLDEGQRRGEDALGRVGSELAGLREEASAKLGEGESVIDGVRTLMTDVGRLSDTLAELGAGTNEELLTGHLERLDARLDAVGNAVPADQLASLGEGQRRGQEVLERLFSELAALRDQTDARLDSELAALRDHTDARLDAIVSAEAERSKAFAGELEAVAAVLEGVGTGLEERGAGRHRELAERLERLSARIEELSAVVPADELVNRIDVLGEAQRRAENTLERLVAELEPGRDEAQAAPVPTELAGVSPDTRPQKKEKKKKKKKH